VDLVRETASFQGIEIKTQFNPNLSKKLLQSLLDCDIMIKKGKCSAINGQYSGFTMYYGITA